MVSAIQKSILIFLWKFVVANRKILQDEFLPNDDDGSQTRDILRRMTSARLIDRVEIKPNGFVTSCSPVYMPNERGCSLLASETGEMRYLLNSVPPKRLYHHFSHFLEVTRILNEYSKGFAQQSVARLEKTILEHHWLNPEAERDKRRKLLTIVGKGDGGGDIPWAPDAVTEVRANGFCALDAWELETGASSPERVSSHKHKGHYLFDRDFRESMFPHCDFMRVIVVCPNAGWRECYRREIRSKKGAELWLCVDVADIRRDGKFITEEPVFFPPEGDPRPLVAPPSSTAGVQGGGVLAVGLSVNGSVEKAKS